MPRAKKAAAVQEGSSHMHSDPKREATHASGERKADHLMEGIVRGIPRKVSPPIIDGIIRGIPKHQTSITAKDTMAIKPSATRDDRAAFGAGLFPSGAH